MSAGTLALWIAAAFALASLVSALRHGVDTVRRTESRRALAMAALFAAVSTVLLLRDLTRADLQVTFVVRHVLTAMSRSARLVSIVGDPAGAGLLAAAVAPVIGLVTTHRLMSRWSTAAMASLTLVLLAAPLAGGPHALLPWTPADGQPATAFARQGEAWIYLAAVVASVAAAMTVLAHALDASVTTRRFASVSLVAIACLATLAVVAHHMAIAGGLVRDSTLLRGRGGAWMALLVVLAAARAATTSEGRARPVTAIALALLATSMVLTSGSWRTFTVAGWVLCGCAIAAGAAAVLFARASWRVPPQPLPSLVALVVVLASLLGITADRRDTRLAPGATLQAGGVTVAHQGISIFDEQDATVLALALEGTAGGTSHLDRAEQREYTDARGSVVGGVMTRPATFAGWRGTTRVWLDSVTVGDQAHLTSAVERGAWLWWLAVALLWLEAVRALWSAWTRQAGTSPAP